MRADERLRTPPLQGPDVPPARPAWRAPPDPLLAAHARLLATTPTVTGPLAKGDRVGTWVFDVIALVNGAAPTTHNLGRVPNGFLALALSANVAWWTGSPAAWTDTTATIQANGAATLSGFWL